MILYRLKCGNNHRFDAWFRDGATFDRQLADGDIDCPYCGDGEIGKVPTAPHLATRSGEARDPEARAQALAEHILKAVGRLRQQVEDNCDYVGDQFPEEARRIHYGETKRRDIYGEATEDEAGALDEEGIEIIRLPPFSRRDD